jgi:hypothetical protein
MRARLALVVIAAAITASCAPAQVRTPGGPWAPDAGAAAAFDDATRACRGARTFSAEIAVSGRAGGSRVRLRILAGFERPGRVRLEGVAPFGAPLFVLVARDDRAVLLLPRDRRVLRGESTGDVLGALTGLKRDADDLLALLSGCVASAPRPGSGSRNPSGWLSLAVGDGLSVFLRRSGADWQLVNAVQQHAAGAVPDWVVEYGEFGSGFPALIGLREDGGAGPNGGTNLTLRVSQRDVNVAIPPAAFEVAVPDDARPITLDELRGRGPLAQTIPSARRSS